MKTMWLPKDERNVLRYLYNRLSRDAIAGTVKLQLKDFTQCDLDTNRCINIAKFLASIDLLKLDVVNFPSGYIMIGFTSSGYDLGRKYSSTIGTLGIWFTEYLWFLVVLSVALGIIGVLTTIIIAVIKD